MSIIEPNITLPEVKLEYVIEEGEKKFRVVSSQIDPLLTHLLKTKQIKIQIWIERELKKRCGTKTRRSWVHSIDKTEIAPPRLFTKTEYNYGGGKGWGWETQDKLPPYSTTNGYAPTEVEISLEDILQSRITKKINVLDIFTNNIRNSHTCTYAVTDDEIKELTILGRNKSNSQPIRVRMVANYQNKVYMSLSSNPIILGIHRDKDANTFDEGNVSKFVKVSYYK